MQIVELLILENEKSLLKNFIQHISPVLVSGYDFPVYRIEIENEIVILLYKLSEENQNHYLIFENIFPHLSGIIALSKKETFDDWRLPFNLSETYGDAPGKTAFILALEQEEKLNESIPQYILDSGLYLGERSRLMFWNVANKNSISNIWRNAFNVELLLSG